ncbi:MAG: hypothetical protein WCP68_11075 [Enhydrobacter sp.]
MVIELKNDKWLRTTYAIGLAVFCVCAVAGGMVLGVIHAPTAKPSTSENPWQAFYSAVFLATLFAVAISSLCAGTLAFAFIHEKAGSPRRTRTLRRLLAQSFSLFSVSLFLTCLLLFPVLTVSYAAFTFATNIAATFLASVFLTVWFFTFGYGWWLALAAAAWSFLFALYLMLRPPPSVPEERPPHVVVGQ